MPAILRFFPIIGFLFIGANLVVWWPRLTHLIEIGRITAQERDGFVRAFLIFDAMIWLPLGVLFLVRGTDRFFQCFRPYSFDTPESAVLSVASVVLLVTLLVWVWRKTGLLSRILPVLGRTANMDRVYSPQVVRRVAAGIAIVIVIMAVVAPRVARAAGDPGCSSASSTNE
jgi:hypothetical protein